MFSVNQQRGLALPMIADTPWLGMTHCSVRCFRSSWLSKTTSKTSKRSLAAPPGRSEMTPRNPRKAGRETTARRAEDAIEIHVYELTAGSVKENIFSVTVAQANNITEHTHHCLGPRKTGPEVQPFRSVRDVFMHPLMQNWGILPHERFERSDIAILATLLHYFHGILQIHGKP